MGQRHSDARRLEKNVGQGTRVFLVAGPHGQGFRCPRSPRNPTPWHDVGGAVTSSSRSRLQFSLASCYAGMMCLAIAVNLTPVLLTTLSTDVGGATGLTKEQLGRIGSVIFAGVIVGIVLAGPLADRVGAKPVTILCRVVIGAGARRR